MRPRFTVVVRLVAGLFFACICFAAMAAPPDAATEPVHTAHGLSAAPAGLAAAIARTQAKDAAHSRAYAIAHDGCASVKTNPKGKALQGCFGNTGPAFGQGNGKVGLRLASWGRAGHLKPVKLTRSSPKANRIEYRGEQVSEWWRVLPMGYEQGFTINKAPAGKGNVILQLHASRAPKVEHGMLAWGKLRYGKLHVLDANGRVLASSLSAQGKMITLAFDARHAQYPVRVDPLVWTQQQELTATNGAANDQLGYSVALDSTGTVALVGAPYRTVGGNSKQGAAYVFTNSGGTWAQAAELTAFNGAADDFFGDSVALSGDGTTALVGASYATYDSTTSTPGPGAAYVFTTADGWSTHTQAAELIASDGVANDNFGWSVALDDTGSTALVGAYNKTVTVGSTTNSGQGAAYVFTEPSGGWGSGTTPSSLIQNAELFASDGGAGDNFGWSVALNSAASTALVGAPYKTLGTTNSFQGVAYVYTSTSGSWTQSAELTASDKAQSDNFGWSVALDSSGSTALVGAYYKTINSNIYQGAAYVFVEPAAGWTTALPMTLNESAELIASNGAAYDTFGCSVALDGTGRTAMVGADGVNTFLGAAYVFTTADGWSTDTQSELTASDIDVTTGGEFGHSVALDSAGAMGLVGADTKAVGSNTAQGVAYSFSGAMTTSGGSSSGGGGSSGGSGGGGGAFGLWALLGLLGLTVAGRRRPRT